MKRLFSVMLIVSMIMSFMSVPALAEEDSQETPDNSPTVSNWPLLEGSKSADLLDRDENSYKVTVQVPGGEGEKKHDAVILMVDGSYSMDSEWNKMKEAIMLIGDTVLNGSGTTKMSMMAFGMSPNVVLENVKSVEELAAELPALPGGLLYGRSSTNCHAAFMGLRDYVAELRAKEGNTLNNVYVLFMSDGQVNQHAKEIDWNYYAMNINPAMAGGAHTCEMDYICAGMVDPSAEAITAFGEDLAAVQAYFDASVEGIDTFYEAGGTKNEFKSYTATITALTNQKNEKEAAITENADLTAAAEAELEGLLATVPEGEDPELNADVIAKRAEIADLQAKAAGYQDELNVINAKLNGLIAYRDNTSAYEAIQNSPSEAEGLSKAQYYVHLVWEHFYEATDFDPAVKYPIHVMETGFLQYQDSLNGNYHIEDCFYYAAMGGAPIGNSGDLAARELAAQEAALLAAEVDGLDMIRYYPQTARNKWMEGIEGATFTESNGISNLTAALGEVLKSLEQTPYNDVVVTDYMSKWVNLRPETIQIADRNGNTVAAFDAENSDVENGIYKYAWIGTPLCAEKDPIVLEKVAPENYAEGGSNAEGNTSGDIYKITWNVKDGPLYRADSYRLEYEVTVDEEESGFQYNKDYPANGNTGLKYTDENGKTKQNDIAVPDVEVPRVIIIPDDPDYYTVTVNYIDKETGEKIAESYTSDLLIEYTQYDVNDKNAITVDGYTYDSTSGDALSGMLDGNKVINVYYIKNVVSEEVPEEPPLVDVGDSKTPLGDVEIEDSDVPLTGMEEEDVPLTDVPKTSDSSNLMLWMMMALLSAAALVGIRIAERKER